VVLRRGFGEQLERGEVSKVTMGVKGRRNDVYLDVLLLRYKKRIVQTVLEIVQRELDGSITAPSSFPSL
jgi:hypothetical protein